MKKYNLEWIQNEINYYNEMCISVSYFDYLDVLKELQRLQQASRWIPVSDPPKHPNWVIAQDEQNNIFPVTFRDLRWLDDEGDELPPYYPQIIKWREMPPPEGE